jgi:hypothetical protein
LLQKVVEKYGEAEQGERWSFEEEPPLPRAIPWQVALAQIFQSHGAIPFAQPFRAVRTILRELIRICGERPPHRFVTALEAMERCESIRDVAAGAERDRIRAAIDFVGSLFDGERGRVRIRFDALAETAMARCSCRGGQPRGSPRRSPSPWRADRAACELRTKSERSFSVRAGYDKGMAPVGRGHARGVAIPGEDPSDLERRGHARIAEGHAMLARAAELRAREAGEAWVPAAASPLGKRRTLALARRGLIESSKIGRKVMVRASSLPSSSGGAACRPTRRTSSAPRLRRVAWRLGAARADLRDGLMKRRERAEAQLGGGAGDAAVPVHHERRAMPRPILNPRLALSGREGEGHERRAQRVNVDAAPLVGVLEELRAIDASELEVPLER